MKLIGDFQNPEKYLEQVFRLGKASMGPGALKPYTLLPPNDPKILERERTKDK
jgi:hypothetical protein